MALTAAAYGRAAPEQQDVEPPRVPRSARILSIAGRVMIGAALILALFAAYQVWGTGIQEARAQGSLRSELDDRLEVATARLAGVTITPSEPADDAPTDATEPIDVAETAPAVLEEEILALFFPEDGDATARIEIPAISTNKVVVAGVQVADLRRGPGHYPSTSRPGNSGNAAVAGHRTTYGAPFGRIDELQPGDEITITSIQGQFTYRVLDPNEAFSERLDDVDSVGEGHILVRPEATWVLGDFGDDRLTLTACHPKYSARQRIIVTAELVGAPADLPPEVEAIRRTSVVQLPGEVISDDVAVGDNPGADSDGDALTAFQPEDSASANLDEGLNGERDAIPVAIVWLVIAAALWLIGDRYAKRRPDDLLGRLTIRATAAVPALVCLWFCFEAADRALPAY